jgi:hypothetical protein
MMPNPATNPPKTRPIDLYDTWLFAAADATLSLEAWRVAGQDGKADACATYRAALDREERAARILELCLRSRRRHRNMVQV